MPPVHKEAVVVSMMESIFRYLDLPVPIVVDAFKLPNRHGLPTIEGTDEIDTLCARKRLSEYP